MEVNMEIERLRLRNVGQIGEAEITFGDLTILVGPQASGKSIFLQFLKLMADTGSIQSELKRYGADWKKDLAAFLDLFLGEGMKSVWQDRKSKIALNGNAMDLEKLVSRVQRNKDESLFLIPAQRVLTLREGWPRPFSDYGPGDPFTVRYFSERLRRLMEAELGREQTIFPRTRRFKTELREMLAANVFGSFDLHVESYRSQKRLVLGSQSEVSSSKEKTSLPFMVWSAGQREFVPLLLGLYWLLPPASVSRRENVRWVVIEELEMGLHPKAIAVVLVLVLELLSRDYRVCLSTHSPHVLDLVWAMRTLRDRNADSRELLEILDVEATQTMREMAEKVLEKNSRVYYFNREKGVSFDISSLDPGAEEAAESGWGGLSEFSGRVADVVARVVGNNGKG
jgi:hypothetical protein